MCQKALKVKLKDKKRNKEKKKGIHHVWVGRTDLERESQTSLFPAFGPSVLVGARGEVDLRCKGYAWTPILWSFDNFDR